MMTDTWTWATVTQASPLRIKVDGDTTPLDATTDDLVGSLAVDDRVRVHLHADGIIVTGIQGGGTPEATAATPNTLALRDANARIKAADGVAADDVATVGQVSVGTQIAAGSISADSLAASESTSVDISFPFTFRSVPYVTATPRNPRLNLGMSANSDTGFTLRIFNWTDATASGDYIHWHAIRVE